MQKTSKQKSKHNKVNKGPQDAKEIRASSKSMKHAAAISFFPEKNIYRILVILLALVAVFFLFMLIVVDAFPTDLLFVIIGVMSVMLIACSILFASRLRRKRVLGILVALIFTIMFVSLSSFLTSTFAMFNKISEGSTDVTSKGPTPKSKDVTEEAFNVYITGIDQWASEKGLDLERSDVNMIVTVNPITKKVLLTSIPRDTYVELYTAKQMDKLTHTGIYGVEETLKTVENWLGIELNYYVKMNYTGARDIIDAMGGIDVYSPVEFSSSIKGYKYYKGWNHLRGKKAVYFARERKSFEGQDAVRVENQQRVLEAMINKLTSSTTLLTKYGSIMNAAGDNLQTNLSTDDIQKLVKMQVAELANWEIETQKIEGEYGEDYVASLTQSQKFSIYRPDETSTNNCAEGINKVLNPDKEELEEISKNRNRSFFVNVGKHIINLWSEKEKKDE